MHVSYALRNAMCSVDVPTHDEPGPHPSAAAQELAAPTSAIHISGCRTVCHNHVDTHGDLVKVWVTAFHIHWPEEVSAKELQTLNRYALLAEKCGIVQEGLGFVAPQCIGLVISEDNHLVAVR